MVAVLAALLLVWGGLRADAVRDRSGFEIAISADSGTRTIISKTDGHCQPRHNSTAIGETLAADAKYFISMN